MKCVFLDFKIEDRSHRGLSFISTVSMTLFLCYRIFQEFHEFEFSFYLSHFYFVDLVANLQKKSEKKIISNVGL